MRRKPRTVREDIPDKDYLYGRYQDAEDRQEAENRIRREEQDKLALKLAHKSLDIPVEEDIDEMDIQVDNSRTGMSTKEFLAVMGAIASAAVLTSVAAGLLLYMFVPSLTTAVPTNEPVTVITPPPSEETPAADSNTLYRLEFGE